MLFADRQMDDCRNDGKISRWCDRQMDGRAGRSEGKGKNESLDGCLNRMIGIRRQPEE